MNKDKRGVKPHKCFETGLALIKKSEGALGG